MLKINYREDKNLSFLVVNAEFGLLDIHVRI